MDVLRLRVTEILNGDWAVDSYGEVHRVTSVEIVDDWAVIHDASHELAVIVGKDAEVSIVREAVVHHAS